MPITNVLRPLITPLLAPLAIALLGAPLLAQALHVAPGNTGLPGNITSLEVGRLTSFIFETAQTGDLNGDGDVSDWVPYLLNTESDTSLTLPLAGITSPNYVDRRFVPVLVNEGSQQLDLNGDGDIGATENVVQIHDLRTGLVQNLGHAITFSDYRVTDELVVMGVREAYQSNQDLNGDGDKTDSVMHVHSRATGHTTNTGLAMTRMNTLHVGPRFVVFLVPESDQGGQDLDGDGDSDDKVIHVYDAHTGLTKNTGLAELIGLSFWALAGDKLVVHVSEAALAVDVDGDGALNSLLIALLDLSSGVAQPTDITWGPIYRPAFVIPAGDAAFTSVPQTDSSSAPCFLQRIDGLTGETSKLDVYLGPLSDVVAFPIEGSRAALLVHEAATDLNGDGDLVDLVAHTLDTRTLKLRNTGLASERSPFALTLAGDALTVVVSEASQGNLDRNGDGDTADKTPTILDLSNGSRVDLPYASIFATGDERVVVISVQEWSQGLTDINGDGDILDLILHAYDRRHGTLTVLGPTTSYNAWVEAPYVAYMVYEAFALVDLNGDGDMQDNVIHITKL